MTRRTLLIGPSPAFRRGIVVALKTIGHPMPFEEFDLGSPPVNIGPKDLLVLCLDGSFGSKQLLSEWLPLNVPNPARVALISPILGNLHRKLIKEGFIDLCLPSDVAIDELCSQLKRMSPDYAGPTKAAMRWENRYLPDLADLSHRQKKLLYHLSCGKKNDDIAAELGIRTHIVRDCLSAIYKKINARNRTHAASIANNWLYEPYL